MKAKIQMTRIDNRLVHGQVGLTWTNSLDVDTIVVIDDSTATSTFAQKLMQSIARSANVAIRFYSVDDFIRVFHENESNQKLFLVVSTPHEIRLLIENDIPAHRINVGNMHYEKGRVPFNRKVYLTKEDIDDFNFMLEKGADLFYQDVPGTVVEKINQLDYDSMTKRR